MINACENCDCPKCVDARRQNGRRMEMFKSNQKGKELGKGILGNHLQVPADVFCPAVPPDEPHDQEFLYGYFDGLRESVDRMRIAVLCFGVSGYAQGRYLEHGRNIPK